MMLAVAVMATFSMVGIHTAAQGGEEITLPVAQGLELKEGDGRDTVVNNCLKCHTLKPILTHEGFSADTWASEVDKMRTKYGAPITDEDAAVIVQYLQTNYTDQPPSSEDLILYGFDNAMATPRPAASPEAPAAASPVASPAATPVQ